MHDCHARALSQATHESAMYFDIPACVPLPHPILRKFFRLTDHAFRDDSLHFTAKDTNTSSSTYLSTVTETPKTRTTINMECT